jgi:hypothetical protein
MIRVACLRTRPKISTPAIGIVGPTKRVTACPWLARNRRGDLTLLGCHLEHLDRKLLVVVPLRPFDDASATQEISHGVPMVAEIFMDTRLTPSRWVDLPASVDRILTGALMWVRTGPESITRYSKLRREIGSTLF